MALNYFTKTGTGEVLRALPGSDLAFQKTQQGWTQGAAAGEIATDLAVPELSQIGVKFKTSADKAQLLRLLAEWNSNSAVEAAQALSAFAADNGSILAGMTKDELIAKADEVGADYKSTMTKDEISAAIIAKLAE